jgi:competence protein CoiA
MLIARDENKEGIKAWEAQRGNKFLCPECQNEVILKQGKIKQAHFAHKPDTDCPYRTNETELHLRIKREIYEALKDYPNCHRCELERRLNGVRPDISLYIGTHPVAIEIQRSDITIDMIIQRTTRYTQLGIYLIWILPELRFNKEGICQAKNWHRFLHRLQVFRLYIWKEGAIIKPIHLEPARVWREQYEDWESGYIYGGYFKELKTRFYGTYPDVSEVHIAKNFMQIERSPFSLENQYLPVSKLWSDTLGRWWIDEDEQS